MGPVWGFCFNLSGGTAMKNSTSHAGAPAQIHVTEMVGVSSESWAEAAQGIIEQATKKHP
jgi:hypothetical protein